MKYPEKLRVGPHISRCCALGISLLVVSAAWCQTDESTRREPVPALVGGVSNTVPEYRSNDMSHPGDRMLTPPPVSGQTFPATPAAAERSNYFRYGVSFTTAYTDNVLGGASGVARSDASYSVAPNAALDVTTSRMHWQASYAPGFTMYQRTDARNEADHNATIEFQYRVSPHATLSASDNLLKSSNVFNQQDPGLIGSVSGGTSVANSSVVVPIADQLRNSASVGLTHQFALNDMIGANGAFTNLYYPNPAQVTGLYESNSQSGSAFLSHRVAQVHYFGITYQYQRLISHPAQGVSETQTHAPLFFYTYFPSARFSLSFFGGPQYADTVQPTLLSSQNKLPELKIWTEAAGASLSYQGRLNTVAFSYSHMVAPGSGLVGAVNLDSGAASFNRQLTRTLSGSMSGGYAQNNYVGSSLLGNNGHSVSGTASLARHVGERVNIQLGYTRLHQTYNGVQILSLNPDTNRGFISISYQFARPLGR